MSPMNYAIVAAAMENKGYKGEPYQDVKTFRGWIAEGRCVRKGEKAFVAVSTWLAVETTRKNKDGKEEVRKGMMPRSAHLFHRDQTDVLETKTA